MIAIIGCGNPTRGDDGIGPEVIRALAARDLARDTRVRMLDAGTDGMGVMFAARGCRTLILIDACRSGSEPGAVFEVPGAMLKERHEPSITLHDFRWEHALFAGRKIFGEQFPEDVTVFLVEADTFDFGIGLSASAQRGADTVVDRIDAIVRARLTEDEHVARAG